MKQFIALIALFCVFCISSTAETIIDWSQYTDEEVESIIDEAYAELDRRIDGGYGSTIIEDDNNASGIGDLVVTALSENKSIVNYSTIDSVTVNANHGTTKSGDYIALVYMTYSEDKGPRYDGSFLISISDDIGRIIEKDFPEINELCIFWNLPIYDSSAKASLSRIDGKMEFEEMYWPKVLSEAR